EQGNLGFVEDLDERLSTELPFLGGEHFQEKAPAFLRADLAPGAVQRLQGGGLADQAGRFGGGVHAGILTTGQRLGNIGMIALEAGNVVARRVPTLTKVTIVTLVRL